LRERGLLPRSYVVLAPGAEYGAAKRWPASHFAQVAREVGAPVVLLGSAKERALCEEIASGAGPDCLNLAGQTRLGDALGWIAAARAVVSNDSGLMHVAAGLGLPQVAVFGSSSPEHTPPLNDRARVLWLKRDASYQPALDCAPCFERECPLGHTRCLHDISAQQVLSALQTLAL
jgi:heptosyltransferase-2